MRRVQIRCPEHQQWRRSAICRSTSWLLTALAACLALGSAHLVGLMIAAARARRVPPPPANRSLRVLVLIPAHDEERVLGATLQALAAIDYPSALVEVVVVADNCRDRTEFVAAAHGVRVLARAEPGPRGKGQVIAWALKQLYLELPSFDAVVVLDADCIPTSNLLSALAARLAAGADGAQAAYLVEGPGESWSVALRWAAFALMNFVRPLGRDTLGLSCGVLGTGFALTPQLLARCPWSAFGLTEDAEYHLHLVATGHRMAFAPEAAVTSPMTPELGSAWQQHLRWESGKWQLARTWSRRLIADGLRRRDAAQLVTGFELAIPPQSLLLVGNVTCLTFGLALRAPWLARLAAVGCVGQAAYVLGGERVAQAPPVVWRSLAMTPALVAWKLAVAARVVSGHGPTVWVPSRHVPDPATGEATLRRTVRHTMSWEMPR
jgi:cellulose synthase/poly-beta-1,6-N-acetylglucosamine synthase-like glycosyltransferase